MEFSRPESWSGEPFPPPGDLPHPGIEPRPPTLEADSLPAEPPGKPFNICYLLKNPVRESRNRHRLEDKCIDTKEGKEGGGNWEIEMDTYRLLILCVR